MNGPRTWDFRVQLVQYLYTRIRRKHEATIFRFLCSSIAHSSTEKQTESRIFKPSDLLDEPLNKRHKQKSFYAKAYNRSRIGKAVSTTREHTPIPFTSFAIFDCCLTHFPGQPSGNRRANKLSGKNGDHQTHSPALQTSPSFLFFSRLQSERDPFRWKTGSWEIPENEQKTEKRTEYKKNNYPAEIPPSDGVCQVGSLLLR